MAGKEEKLKYIATDIDGVLTDGRVSINVNGTETKQICYRDLDAIGIGRRHGFEFIFVTGESGAMVKRLADRFHVSLVYEGAKDKLSAVKDICRKYGVSENDLVYIGDSDRDAQALEFLSNSFAPADATRMARSSASRVVDVRGGYGVLLEVVDLLLKE